MGVAVSNFENYFLVEILVRRLANYMSIDIFAISEQKSSQDNRTAQSTKNSTMKQMTLEAKREDRDSELEWTLFMLLRDVCVRSKDQQ